MIANIKSGWRIATAGFVLAALLALAVAPVSAASSPAQNAPACEDVGGVFEHNPGGTNTCTVPGSTVPGPTYNTGPTGNWTVFTETTIAPTVYTWAPGNVTGVSGGEETTVPVRCHNPGGEEMDLSHQHCQI